MKNVIIFGTGTTSKIVLSGLKDNINILYYCDNDKQKWGEIYNNVEIISPERIQRLNYDFIVIASQFNDEIYNQLLEIGVCPNKIFQFFKYVDSLSNCVKVDVQKVIDSKQTVQGIITGISYAESGINEKILIKKTCKMARHSQDLYFDYHLVKYVIDNYKEVLNTLKYVFISLSYYSFEYDMSYSAMKGKVPLYYQVIGKKHNLHNIHEYINKTNVNRDIAKEIFNLYQNGYLEVDWYIRNNYDNTSNLSEDIGKKQALLDGNKNYPETVKENIEILRKYLKLLKDNNIKPVVIVCPVSKYYAKYFPKRLIDEFYMIIRKIGKEYNFQFLDYFDSNLFCNEDFYDVSHLNHKGAEKFTNILNDVIDW